MAENMTEAEKNQRWKDYLAAQKNKGTLGMPVRPQTPSNTNQVSAGVNDSFLGDLARHSGDVARTIFTGNDGFQLSDIPMAIPRAVGVVGRGFNELGKVGMGLSEKVADVGNQVVGEVYTGLGAPRPTVADPASAPPPSASNTTSPNTTPLYPGSNIARFTHDIGDQQLRTYTTPQGSLSGMVPASRGQGGFVGAATDAEAARNLQARFAQDEAARRIAQSTDRAIESMRGVRAEQMGIPRASLDASEGRVPQQPMDPNMQRFLLDQAKFESQQGIDRARLGIEQGTLENKQAGTALQEQEYKDTQRAAFMENFSYPDENAPRDQIAADVWMIAEATGGLVPPEVVAQYYQRVSLEEGIDWGKGGPKDPMELAKKVMAKIAQDYQGD